MHVHFTYFPWIFKNKENAFATNKKIIFFLCKGNSGGEAMSVGTHLEEVQEKVTNIINSLNRENFDK